MKQNYYLFRLNTNNLTFLFGMILNKRIYLSHHSTEEQINYLLIK